MLNASNAISTTTAFCGMVFQCFLFWFIGLLVEFVKEDGKLIKADFMTKLHNRVEYNRQYRSLAYSPNAEVGDGSDADE